MLIFLFYSKLKCFPPLYLQEVQMIESEMFSSSVLVGSLNHRILIYGRKSSLQQKVLARQ